MQDAVQQKEKAHTKNEEIELEKPPASSSYNWEITRIALLAIIALTLAINTFVGNETELSAAKTASAVQPINPQPTNNDPFSLRKNISDPDAKNAFQPKGPITSLKFTEEVFDYGDIDQNSENHHNFKFKNTGEHPLIINTASGSCGCTVPEWPKAPIPPGGTGEIKVTYKPGTQQGKQTKSVTVFANTDPVQTIVKIKANVHSLKKEEQDN